LREQNFHLIMHALFIVGERWYLAEKVDRNLVLSVWYMCSTARRYGLHPTGMLQSNKLITGEETARLERWIDLIENVSLGFLNGRAPHEKIEQYAEYVWVVGPGDNIEYFIPLMRQFLDDLE